MRSRDVVETVHLLQRGIRAWIGRGIWGRAIPHRLSVNDGHPHKRARRAAPPGSCAVPNEWNPKRVPGSAPGTGKERAPPREIREWVVFMVVDIGGQRCLLGQDMPY